MRFPKYSRPPLRHFACKFTLAQAFNTTNYASALSRIYEDLRVDTSKSNSDDSVALTNEHGLQVIITSKSFTVGVSSIELQHDFLQSAAGNVLPVVQKFTDVSDWQTLKNFTAAALLQHGDPTKTLSIELCCRNAVNCGARFEEIGDWLELYSIRLPQLPPCLPDTDDNIHPPEPLVASNCTAFMWQNSIFITVETKKKALQPGFELVISSHIKPEYQGAARFDEWYQETMMLLDKLRDANFLMFNSAVTDKAKAVFGIEQA